MTYSLGQYTQSDYSKSRLNPQSLFPEHITDTCKLQAPVHHRLATNSEFQVFSFIPEYLINFSIPSAP